MITNKLLVKDKEIVIPGQELAQGLEYLPSQGTFREEDKIISTYLGLVSINQRFIKVIPLTGKYVPKADDMVIGKVTDIGFYGWTLDIGCAYHAVLSLRETSGFIERNDDLTKYYDYGDVVVVGVTRVTKQKSVDLTTKGPGLKKLIGGKIIEVTPSKVPRMIGKQGSMITMLKEKTGCNIIIGQNGRVWIKGDSTDQEALVTKTIMKIEKESHIDGLTDKIKTMLESKKWLRKE